MSKVAAVFGAGPGLGRVLAQHLGRLGYDIALVGRRSEVLDTLAAELANDGIQTANFQADLTDDKQAAKVVTDILERFGRIDILEYSPVITDAFTPASELDRTRLLPFIQLFLLSPIAAIQAALPDMLARGSGGIFVTQGGTAVRPVPGMSGVGPVMAATRNYLYSLHGELADKGIYVGTLSNSAVIEGSAYHHLIEANAKMRELYRELPKVAPEHLASIIADMIDKADRVESIWPAG